MSRIKIRNFGPIKDGYGDEWIDIKKVTLFIGNQGSGKSTITKLISTFSWIEKALTRGDFDIKHFERKNKLKNQYLTYHRLENYFSKSDNNGGSHIDYQGQSFNIIYQKGNLSIQENRREEYDLPQIMYVPAERNFIANVKSPKALKLTSNSLLEFVSEYVKALDDLKGLIRLPINDVDLEYNKQFDTVYIRGKVKNDTYKIKLSEASSGFQSLVPLYLVSKFLSSSVKYQSDNYKDLMTSEQRARFLTLVKAINDTPDLTAEQRRIAISASAGVFNKSAFINIVEEPEQNLFPISQHQLLNSLLEFNNLNEGNKLIMTTHSPYLINYLTLAVKAFQVKDIVNEEGEINKIVPLSSTINPGNLAIYELNEINGTVNKLSNYKGLPSDENYLNQRLAETNFLFDDLMKIEKNGNRFFRKRLPKNYQ